MTAADCLQRYRDAVQETELFIAEAHIMDSKRPNLGPGLIWLR
jgi:hypothetical protein